ncbi:MAG: hypothetical protein Edafosvirus2_36 [Edafosvirus sp.]|uniref:Uncharacterized protein n=1 Tax=Edafosvirus sp. TaxID=2487765 RepID=A0A3G4ZSJ0_9VIRU|nr:MAG: hypothetical protein Edafosvirus2_36 [Edafosvirus sp.]
MQNKFNLFTTIFNNITKYKNLNIINDKQLRDSKDGLQIYEALLYKLLYTKKNATKESVTAILNNIRIKNKKKVIILIIFIKAIYFLL